MKKENLSEEAVVSETEEVMKNLNSGRQTEQHGLSLNSQERGFLRAISPVLSNGWIGRSPKALRMQSILCI